LTGEKLKKKFCSLKLTRPPDEFVIFDTRPQDFIVVSDDLTTANMNPCCKILKGVDKSVMVFFLMKIVCIILSLFYIIYYFISADTGLSEVFPKVWLLWMSYNVEGRDLERN